jgi:hypothetical protein
MSQKPFEAEVTRIYQPNEARMKKAVKTALDWALLEKAKKEETAKTSGDDKPAA